VKRVVKWFEMFVLTTVLLLVTVFILPVPEPAKQYIAEGIKKIEQMVQRAESSVSTADASQQVDAEEHSLNVDANHNQTTDKWHLLVAYAREIYLNNIAVLLFLSIPLGIFGTYPLTVIMNGWVLSILATNLSVPVLYVVMMLLFAPHTWIELFSYSIVAYESFHLSFKVLRKNVARKDIVMHCIFIILASTILFIAAIVESLTIILLRG